MSHLGRRVEKETATYFKGEQAKMAIRYTDKIPSPDDLYKLYDCEGWNEVLNIPKESLHQAMVNSWYVVSGFDEHQIIATGRVISDGLINAYLCGLVVHPDYRNRGVGTEIVRRLVDKGRSSNLHIELFTESENIPYYQKLGFEQFATGMKHKNS